MRVLVGPDKKIFTIHKRLVCQVSSYFDAALNGKFKESVDDEISMPHQEHHLFNHFVEWVYSNQIDLPKLNGEGSHDNDVWETFSKLYLLARYLQCPGFGNSLLDSVPHERKEVGRDFCLPPGDVLTMVYDGTIEGCGLRRYFVALYVWKMNHNINDEEYCKKWFALLPVEFIRDVAIHAIRGVYNHGGNPFIMARAMCTFHDQL